MRAREQVIEIQHAMALAGVSQADIARTHNCSDAMVSGVILGRNVSAPVESVINKAVGCDLFNNSDGISHGGDSAKEGGI